MIPHRFKEFQISEFQTKLFRFKSNSNWSLKLEEESNLMEISI